ncbi:MAG: Fis family transcriptional regulator [Treponema sp.]|nr:MAG: Fis family transcriptional regulator [Treponema sp.]
MEIPSSIDKNDLTALMKTTLLISSNFSNLNDVLYRVVESAMTVVKADAASLLIVDESVDKLRFEIALGPKGFEVKNMAVSMDKGIAGWVVRNNKSAMINDVSSDSRFDPTVQQSTGYESKNMLAVPMKVDGVCIGVIEVLNKVSGQDFSFDDLQILELFARQVAVAYLNARSYDRSKNEVACLQDQLNQDKGYHTMIAESPVMQDRLELCKKVAKSNASVLILGQSGVGKELIAEQIHLSSDRSDKPFIRVNCAAIPESLLESELFGHVRGAFTDAVADRKGRFETADNGTIFLDEIGDISLATQAKLLRVLQNKSFERLGSNNTITVNTRVIAATNRDIEKLVEDGKFRADLYYRLNVLPIYVPPLKQRLEDITPLAEFFLKRFSKEVKKDFYNFSQPAIERLLSYTWPGNIRELENAIERACVIGSPPYIQVDDLLLTNDLNKTIDINAVSTLKDAVNTFKKSYIQSVIKKTAGNQTVASELLGVQRTYLSKLIKELNIKEY